MKEVKSHLLSGKNGENHAIEKSPKFLLTSSAGSIWLKFQRFIRDIIGLFLIVFSLLIVLGLFDLTGGIFLSPIIKYIKMGLGWGSIFVPILGGFMGFVFINRPSRTKSLKLSRILAIEGMIFSFLAILALFGNRSLEDAEMGKYGGVIGWGILNLIESIFPPFLSPIILFLLIILFTLMGFGLFSILSRQLEAWLFKTSSSIPEGDADSTKVEIIYNENVKKRNIQKSKDKLNPKSIFQEIDGRASVTDLQRDENLPPLDLLFQDQLKKPDEQNIHDKARVIEKTLAEFGIPVKVVGYRIGPTITQFAVEPGFIEKNPTDADTFRQKVRVSQISTLAKDLALALAAERLRVEAPVPGRSFVGIEVPNVNSEIVRLRSILETEVFQKLSSSLAIALGRNVSGQAVVADLAKMPHLLIAGTTGSGKSVFIAAITVCLVMNNSPKELRLAMLDPKMVELVRFNGLPHLLGKVETSTERMLGILRWALAEMDRRYHLLEETRSRDISSYNRRMVRRKLEPLPRIVILIDELADLMVMAPDQTEHSLIRLAQMARATGIHLVLATQRPSIDVVTGLIKANFPARVSFTVASSVDSRVILDTAGAESLLGKGDMLFLNPEVGSPIRVQGVLVTDQEVEKVINYWQKMPVPEETKAPWEELLSQDEGDSDELIKQAISIVSHEKRASASLLQRRLRIGYPRAARLIDELENLGIIGPAQSGGRDREVLFSPENDLDSLENNDSETEE